jgi:hypothetical protein
MNKVLEELLANENVDTLRDVKILPDGTVTIGKIFFARDDQE